MAESIDSYSIVQETGLSYEQRWQIIQHFTEWIKHGDSKIQTLLTVQAVIIATYGVSVPVFFFKSGVWNFWTIFCNAAFVLVTLASFIYGFFSALQPYTKPYEGKDKNRNVFFYGSYSKDELLFELENLNHKEQLQQLSAQISVLGRVTKNKFRHVQNLQQFVVISIILLIPVYISFSLVR